MKHVMISLEEEYVKKLRTLAKGGKTMKKGAISTTVKEAIDLLEKDRKREEAWKRLKVLMDEDIKWGVGRFDRNEIYRGKRFGGH